MNNPDLARCFFYLFRLEKCAEYLPAPDAEDKYSVLNHYFLSLARGDEIAIRKYAEIIFRKNFHLNIETEKTILNFAGFKRQGKKLPCDDIILDELVNSIK